MLRYLLDTDICIYLLKHKPPELRTRFNEAAAEIAVSAVTVAELFYGAEKSARAKDNREQVQHLLALVESLPFDDNAASHFGAIRTDLEKAGQIIGAYDLMIAAVARCRGLTVVTHNTREFTRVPGLLVEDWVADV